MSNPIWESLPKNQTDSTTILEAIANLIAEHNNDPDAHNLPDQSLYLHRINDIIDHPAGSVKNDKASFNQFYYNLLFSDWDNWNTLYFNYNNNDTSSYWNDGITNRVAYFYRDLDFHSVPFNSDTSRFVEIFYQTESVFGTTAKVNIGMAVHSSDTDLQFTGFKQVGKVLYAHHWISTGGYVDYQVIADLNGDAFYNRLRVFYSASEKMIYWYINGTLVYSYDVSTDLDSMNTDSQLGVVCNFGNTGIDNFQVSFFTPVISIDTSY